MKPALINVAVLVLAGCSQPQPQRPQSASPQPHAVVHTEVHEVHAVGVVGPPHVAQPPDIKLKLGHYSNAERGIGLVIDRTGKEAKVRFDGTDVIFRLDPTPGSHGRIDYLRTINNVMLHVWKNGRVVVYVPNSDEGGIEVRRDGDADPL